MNVKKIYLFSATWCGPCKVFHKTFDAVKEMENYKEIEFITVDIEDDDDAIQDMIEDLVIKSVPTIVLYGEENKVLDRFVGNVSQQEFIDKINAANEKTE